MYLYVNGSLSGTLSATAPNAASFHFYIGKDPQGGWGSPKYTGKIDDVRIYNRALSAGEISQLYSQ